MNARGKDVDTTYLSLELAEERGFIHRDYIAHCLRWTHVCKRLAERKSYQSARILDVGCGRELPLAKTLYSSRYIPSRYYGVDYGPVEDSALAAVTASGKFPATVFERTDFCSLTLDDLHGVPANWVTCFEVLEHVEPAHCLEMLRHIKRLCSPDAKIFISTPCWNVVDCAANHVNEIKYEALGSVFEREGFTVKSVYGTFASIRDYEHLLNEEQAALFRRLREYYDTNFLSCVFAPLFPAQSRNALWELSIGQVSMEHTKFPEIFTITAPWSSSAKWEDFARC